MCSPARVAGAQAGICAFGSAGVYGVHFSSRICLHDKDVFIRNSIEQDICIGFQGCSLVCNMCRLANFMKHIFALVP